MMEGNKSDRDRLHSICEATLSLDKSVNFVAIIDSRGKIIVGHIRGSRLNNENHVQSFNFYRDSLLPVITSMRRENVNAANNTKLRAILIDNKGENCYIVAYSEDE